MKPADNEKEFPATRTPLTTSETPSSVSLESLPNNNNEGNTSGTSYYYLSPNAVKRLPQYHYRGADLSPFYKHVLSPFASWCVDTFTPSWVAPNTITLLGLAWMAFSYCVLWYYCPGMYEANTNLVDVDHTVPGAIFLLNGIAMLLYQTLDNMDGKQARKTGSSSPLGLLFDHGCDVITAALSIINWIVAMALDMRDLPGSDAHDNNMQNNSLLSEFIGGDGIISLLFLFGILVGTYICTWELYYTGSFILEGFNGADEGVVLGATFSLVSFFYTPMYWQTSTWADGSIAMLQSFIGDENIYLSSMHGRVRNMDVYAFAFFTGFIWQSTPKLTSVVRTKGLQSLRTLVPNLLLVTSTVVMLHCDPNLMLRSPRTMVHLISGLFAEQTTQMMLDHMGDEEFEVRQRWPLFPYVLLAGWMMMTGSVFSANTLDAILLAYTTGLWVYLAFKFSVQISEMCDVLGIWFFDIVTPHPKAKLSEVRRRDIAEREKSWRLFQQGTPNKKKKMK